MCFYFLFRRGEVSDDYFAEQNNVGYQFNNIAPVTQPNLIQSRPDVTGFDVTVVNENNVSN